MPTPNNQIKETMHASQITIHANAILAYFVAQQLTHAQGLIVLDAVAEHTKKVSGLSDIKITFSEAPPKPKGDPNPNLN